MHAVVTGGAGFIGSHIARDLSTRGKSVRVFDNLSTGRLENLAGVDVDFVRGDVRELSDLRSAFDGADVVLHQAALPSVTRSISDPRASHDSNATGTLNVLEAARQTGVKRVVYASSSSAYGGGPELPKHESMPVVPRSPYAAAKLAGEHYCRVFGEVFGLETISLRYFNVFGPRQDPASEYAAVIPKFIVALLEGRRPTVHGDGQQSRDFTYIDNVVDANRLAASANPTCAGEWVNIACGARISLLELLAILMDILGMNEVQPEYADSRPGDVRHSQADISKAGALLGYVPQVDLQSGLERTVDWFRRVHQASGA